MPSDARVRLALDALAAPARAFQTALETTADDVKATLAGCRGSWQTRVAQAAAELGPLATGRIDPEHFAAVFLERGAPDPAAVKTMEQALATLTSLAARGEELLRVRVPSGGSLYAAVGAALADIGRGFAAARAVAAVRGAAREDETLAPPEVGGLPFARWSRQERRLVPPLVVNVGGADLRAAALAEFLDGAQRIVLVVDGECSAAPLVRLIAPGTLVVQTADGTGLERLAAWQGPGIAALVGESAARFVHDPAAGATPAERLTITALPERLPRRTVAGLSVAQQTEELELLKSLAVRPVAQAPSPAATAPDGGDPADRLASWLLSQVDLSEVR